MQLTFLTEIIDFSKSAVQWLIIRRFKGDGDSIKTCGPATNRVIKQTVIVITGLAVLGLILNKIINEHLHLLLRADKDTIQVEIQDSGNNDPIQQIPQ